MVFEGDVSEVDVDKIKVGTPMEISVATSPGTTIRGVVNTISPTATRTKGITTYRVFATVDLNSAGGIHVYSGCSATGRIITAKADSVWALNEKYVHYDGDSVYVDIVDEKDRVKKQYVKLGISDGLYTEVVSGIDSLTRIKKID